MRTILPTEITTVEQAKAFLQALHSNGEAYHPEDNALECFDTSSDEDLDWCRQVNRLMEQVYNLEGNIAAYPNLAFDPCAYLNELAGHVVE